MNQPEDFNAEAHFADLDGELTEVLRPVAPPDGFADRILSRIETDPGEPARAAGPTQVPAKVVTMRPRPAPSARLTGAIAATLIAGVFVVQQTRVRHQREEAEQAQRQFESAISITDHALDHTRAQLRQAGIRFGD